MNISKPKNPKSNIIKIVIITMSVLYVLGPLHIQVNKLLHTIVHALEMPDNILSHKSSSSTFKVHKSNVHKNVVEQHNHNVIDLVETILKGANNENESHDKLIELNKVDKHIKIRNSLDDDRLVFLLKTSDFFVEKESKLSKGFVKGFKEPPKNISFNLNRRNVLKKYIL